MPHVDTPWVGLGALVLMFAIPYLPNWLFEGPRVIRHWPRRHVCALCGAAWRDGHDCLTADDADTQRLSGRLDRLPERPAITSRSASPAEPDNF
jgi:hypothetical protein